MTEDADGGNGAPVMTKAWLKMHCKKTNQYMTPSLNDKLYLHFKGFEEIANLEEYTGLRALFIEGNGLDSLKGLTAAQKELRCLFAQGNCISRISDLEHITALNTLNLSNNRITHVECLSHLPDLQTLQLASNKLETLDSIRHLADCPVVSTVDLSGNNLDGPDPEAFLDLFRSVPSLQVLYLKGNPIVAKVPHYRKRLIAGIPKLTYLDDRPVFEAERRLSEAWIRGGFDEERRERQRMKEEEAEKEARQMSFMRGIRDAALARRQAAEAQANGGLTDAEVDAAVAAAGGLDDDSWEEVAEPDELVRAREALAQYAARPGEEEPPELTEARARLAAEGRLQAVETRPWGPADPSADEEEREAASPGTPPAGDAGGRPPSAFAPAAAGERGSGARGGAESEEDADQGQDGGALAAAAPLTGGSPPLPDPSEAASGASSASLADADAAAGSAAGPEDGGVFPPDTPDTPEQRELKEKWGADAAAAAAAVAEVARQEKADAEHGGLPAVDSSSLLLHIDDIILQQDDASVGHDASAGAEEEQAVEAAAADGGGDGAASGGGAGGHAAAAGSDGARGCGGDDDGPEEEEGDLDALD